MTGPYAKSLLIKCRNGTALRATFQHYTTTATRFSKTLCVSTCYFQKWFDAQFVDCGVSRWQKMTIQQLNDAVRDGQDAAAELQRRRERQEMERAALYAWNYLMPLPEPPEVK